MDRVTFSLEQSALYLHNIIKQVYTWCQQRKVIVYLNMQIITKSLLNFSITKHCSLNPWKTSAKMKIIPHGGPSFNSIEQQDYSVCELTVNN